MAHSKDVLAVLGRLCVDEEFRERFFGDPQGEALSFVGELGEREQQLIANLAGKGKLSDKYSSPAAYVTAIKGHLRDTRKCLNCPDPPCPWNGY